MKRTKLSAQVEGKHAASPLSAPEPKIEYDGQGTPVSTGSTLLDLAISGGRFREGGIPPGIFVEIFGPSGAGKTVLLCQIAANVQRMGGKVMFHDPEARLNHQFARLFGFDVDSINYTMPDTIPEVFGSVRQWVKEKEDDEIYGVFADSLAALSTQMEMSDDGDKMGMRRAKEFSEELRKTCRLITKKNVLMVASNQIRQNPEAGMFGPKYRSPGGEALAFYASLRLRVSTPTKINVKRTVNGKEYERTIGVKTTVEVVKSSVWKPYHTADIYILYDYGIDDIRGNLMWLKSATGDKVFRIGERELGKTVDKAIREVEENNLEQELKAKVIEVWNDIQEAFVERRKPRWL